MTPSANYRGGHWAQGLGAGHMAWTLGTGNMAWRWGHMAWALGQRAWGSHSPFPGRAALPRPHSLPGPQLPCLRNGASRRP